VEPFGAQATVASVFHPSYRSLKPKSRAALGQERALSKGEVGNSSAILPRTSLCSSARGVQTYSTGRAPILDEPPSACTKQGDTSPACPLARAGGQSLCRGHGLRAQQHLRFGRSTRSRTLSKQTKWPAAFGIKRHQPKGSIRMKTFFNVPANAVAASFINGGGEQAAQKTRLILKTEGNGRDMGHPRFEC